MGEVKLNVRLLAATTRPLETIALAGKLCYSDERIDTLCIKSAAEADRFVSRLTGFGHLSPIEHASFTFGVEGVSRSLLAQLTRHRIASFSVQSQRYVTKDTLTYILPPGIAGLGSEATELYTRQMDSAMAAYLSLMELGAKAEDARFVLPNAAETRLILTMNARELMHFFALRCCERAQWEIRAMAWAMLGMARREAPGIFASSGASCIAGACTEGNMSCKRMALQRERSGRLSKLLEEGADDAAITGWAMREIYD